MRRSTSRIGKLPGEVLDEVNQKLYEGWGYPLLRKWLFEQMAEEDVPALGLAKGEKFSAVWLRAAKSPGNAGHFCELALGTWFRTWHPLWVKEKLRRGDSMRVVRRAAALTREVRSQDSEGRKREVKAESGKMETCGRGDGAVGDRRRTAGGTPREGTRPTTDEESELSVEGGDVLMRSVLIDAISTVKEDGKDPREIAQLANAWARLNQGKVEEEKLQLKTQSAFELACDGLGKEIKGIPEALELFYKLREVVERAKRSTTTTA